jgi:CheY-like chemotaxis protein/HPt (histidine-containing phosphotransfer) domain-containing protein
VEDVVIGLSEAAHTRLFQPFTQADGSITRKYGGTGLGLTISRSLAELMGGEMDADGREGAGSTFRFTALLPRCADAKRIPSHPSVLADASSRWRVLVAEDNVVNQQLISRQLATLGSSCDVVADGVKAFTSVVGGHCDLVLMDLQMPVLDGFSATRLIRQWEKEQKAAPIAIVAITANGTTSDRARCLEFGMNEHLPKPLRIGDLSAVLHRFLDRPAPPAVSTVHGEESRPELDADTIEGLLALGEDDGTFLRELVDQYRTDADARIAGLERAAERGEHLPIRTLAHALRGSSANLGAVEVTEACRSLEELTEENVEAYIAAVGIIREAYSRVLPLLEALAFPAGEPKTLNVE